MDAKDSSYDEEEVEDRNKESIGHMSEEEQFIASSDKNAVSLFVEIFPKCSYFTTYRRLNQNHESH